MIFDTYSLTQMVYKELFNAPLKKDNQTFVVESLMILQWDNQVGESLKAHHSSIKSFSF